MSTFDDLSTDAGKLRAMLNDRDANTALFQDADLSNLLLEANGFVAPIASLPAQRLYWAAHLGWLQKCGKRADESKRQQIAIIKKDTHVTFLDASEMAEKYRKLSMSAGDICVQIPVLDTVTPMLDTTNPHDTLRYGWSIDQEIW